MLNQYIVLFNQQAVVQETSCFDVSAREDAVRKTENYKFKVVSFWKLQYIGCLVLVNNNSGANGGNDIEPIKEFLKKYIRKKSY